MKHKRKALHHFLSAFVLMVSLSLTSLVQAQDGKALFNQKCASCHAIDKNLVGPALKGVEDRWDDKAMLYDWVRNSAAVIKKGYPRAVAVYNEYNKVQMTAFPELKNEDIDAILSYINTGGAKAAAAAAAYSRLQPQQLQEFQASSQHQNGYPPMPDPSLFAQFTVRT